MRPHQLGERHPVGERRPYEATHHRGASERHTSLHQELGQVGSGRGGSSAAERIASTWNVAVASSLVSVFSAPVT